MKITKFNSYQNLNSMAAEALLSQVKANPKSVLGLATGRTFIPIYAELVRRAKVEKISFNQVTTFNLDEYAGIEYSDSHSFHFYMQAQLFSKLDFNPKKSFFPNLPGEKFEKLIADHGGIDFQYLGLGINGHIGFNEPGSSFTSVTRLVQLSESTKIQNADSFSGLAFPTEAITMGLSTISRAKKCLLVVSGASKAQILFDCLQKIHEHFPASLLQTHPDCELYVDQAAFALLEKHGQRVLQGD